MVGRYSKSQTLCWAFQLHNKIKWKKERNKMEKSEKDPKKFDLHQIWFLRSLSSKLTVVNFEEDFYFRFFATEKI